MPVISHNITSFPDLFQQRGILKVPHYQRGYSWEEVNFVELWEDLVNTVYQDEQHFLGVVILSENRDEKLRNQNYYEIIDGQQRLTTFSILFRAMFDEIEKNDYLKNDIYETTIYDDQKGKYRLTLSEEDQNIFFNWIQKNPRDKNRKKGRKKSHKSIRAALDFYREKIEELADNENLSVDDIISTLYKNIKRHTQILQIVVPTDADAYTIFETINARRVDLTTSELLKNYLYSVSRHSTAPESTLHQLQDSWLSMIEDLDNVDRGVDVSEYIRHYWASTKADVRAKQLYRELRGSIGTDVEKAEELLDNLSSEAISYAAILDPELSHEKLDLTSLEKFSYFNIRQTYPLLLSALALPLPQEQFDDLVFALEALTVRRGLYGSNPNELEGVFSTTARKIRDNGIGAIPPLLKDLKNKYNISDEQLKTSLTRGGSTSSYYSKYILQRMEKEKSTAEKQLISFTLEHIMPQKITNDSWKVSPEEHEYWVNNIGNLTLVGKSFNSSMKNRPFEEKKKVFLKSDVKIARELAENYDTWDIETIQDRAESIFSFVAKHWPQSLKRSDKS